MITEGICLDIVLKLYGKQLPSSGATGYNTAQGQRETLLNLDLRAKCFWRPSTGSYCRHSLQTIRDNVEWLKLTGHVGWTRIARTELELLHLTLAGEEFARSGRVSAEHRAPHPRIKSTNSCTGVRSSRAPS
jgi:hypothetical protein